MKSWCHIIYSIRPCLYIPIISINSINSINSKSVYTHLAPPSLVCSFVVSSLPKAIHLLDQMSKKFVLSN